MEDDWIKTDLDLVRIGGDARQVVTQWAQSGRGSSCECRFEGTELEVERDPQTGVVILRPLRSSPLECLRSRDVLLDQEQWTNDDFAVLMKRDDLAKTARHGVEAL